MKYSFILEIDEISKDDINELISVLSDNKIKFHVLKSDKELKENQKLKEHLKIKHDGFMASVDESCEYAEENKIYKEVIDNLKDKLMEYFEVGRDSYFYVLTRDKSAFDYGTMSFDDFIEFSEEQVDDIVDFLKEVEHE